jgi:hypothetical protein
LIIDSLVMCNLQCTRFTGRKYRRTLFKPGIPVLHSPQFRKIA